MRTALVGNDFDPVAIGVDDESDALHLAIVGLLLERNTELFQSVTGLVDIVDGDGDMAESPAWVAVTVRVLEARVVFSSMVVRQLENTFSCEAGLGLFLVCESTTCVVVRKEVEGKVVVDLLGVLLHSEEVAVEFQGRLRVPDAKHGMVEPVTKSSSHGG